MRRETNLMYNLFLVYFVNPYMFRAYLGPSSGGTTVCIQQLVLIILFSWMSVLLGRTTDSRLKRILSTNCCIYTVVDCVWNVMAHAQKPDFIFRWNGRVHLTRQGRQFSRLLCSRGVHISDSNGSNAGYTMFRGSVKGTGYPHHSPVSLSLALPCVTVYHHISIGVYVNNSLA